MRIILLFKYAIRLALRCLLSVLLGSPAQVPLLNWDPEFLSA